MAPDFTAVAVGSCGLAVVGCFTMEFGVIEQAVIIIMMMIKQLLIILFNMASLLIKIHITFV
jgi:hypothetical protein